MAEGDMEIYTNILTMIEQGVYIKLYRSIENDMTQVYIK